MSFHVVDEDKWIDNLYWVCLEEVLLDFDSSWTGSGVGVFKEAKSWGSSEVVKGCRRWVGPRSLEWAPSTISIVRKYENILVQYGEDNDGLPYNSVITEWEDVEALALGAEYQHGTARLEIKRDSRCGASTVRLVVRKIYGYLGLPFLNLSVVIEDIRRDEWNNLLEYQQELMERNDVIFEDVPCTFLGNERVVVKQIPESHWQDDRSDVINDVRHVAHESLPLLLEYDNAQTGAVQQGLSRDDFQWEYPIDHETRVVRRPSTQTDTPLRALRLDISIYFHIYAHAPSTVLYIGSIELQITSITRSPSRPSAFSSCTLRLDAPYAALANAAIPNHSSQIIEIPTDSRSAEHLITTNGLMQTINVHVVQVVGPVAGDVFAGPIHGGNVGGRNNINNITTPTPGTSSRRKGGVFVLHRLEFLPGLRGIFRSTKKARVQESANGV